MCRLDRQHQTSAAGFLNVETLPYSPTPTAPGMQEISETTEKNQPVEEQNHGKGTGKKAGNRTHLLEPWHMLNGFHILQAISVQLPLQKSSLHKNRVFKKLSTKQKEKS